MQYINLLLNLGADFNRKDGTCRPTIGLVASFDDFSEIITEFYQEWKQKNKVKSSTLKALVTKLSTNFDQVKDDNLLISQESTASESLITNTQDYQDKASITFKKRPKRRGGGLSNLQDVL